MHTMIARISSWPWYKLDQGHALILHCTRFPCIYIHVYRPNCAQQPHPQRSFAIIKPIAQRERERYRDRAFAIYIYIQPMRRVTFKLPPPRRLTYRKFEGRERESTSTPRDSKILGARELRRHWTLLQLVTATKVVRVGGNLF